MDWNTVATEPDGSKWVDQEEADAAVAKLEDAIRGLSRNNLMLCEDLRYLAGIVERGTGEPVPREIPVTQLVLGYVMFLEREIADAHELEKAFRSGISKARDYLADAGQTAAAREFEEFLARHPVSYAKEAIGAERTMKEANHER